MVQLPFLRYNKLPPLRGELIGRSFTFDAPHKQDLYKKLLLFLFCFLLLVLFLQYTEGSQCSQDSIWCANHMNRDDLLAAVRLMSANVIYWFHITKQQFRGFQQIFSMYLFNPHSGFPELSDAGSLGNRRPVPIRYRAAGITSYGFRSCRRKQARWSFCRRPWLDEDPHYKKQVYSLFPPLEGRFIV